MSNTSAGNPYDDKQQTVAASSSSDNNAIEGQLGGDVAVKNTDNATATNDTATSEEQEEDEDDDEDFPKFGDTPRGRIAGPVAGQKPAGNRPR